MFFAELLSHPQQSLRYYAYRVLRSLDLSDEVFSYISSLIETGSRSTKYHAAKVLQYKISKMPDEVATYLASLLQTASQETKIYSAQVLEDYFEKKLSDHKEMEFDGIESMAQPHLKRTFETATEVIATLTEQNWKMLKEHDISLELLSQFRETLELLISLSFPLSFLEEKAKDVRTGVRFWAMVALQKKQQRARSAPETAHLKSIKEDMHKLYRSLKKDPSRSVRNAWWSIYPLRF